MLPPSTIEAPPSDTPTVQREQPLFQDNGVGQGRPYKDSEISVGLPWDAPASGPGRPEKPAER